MQDSEQDDGGVPAPPSTGPIREVINLVSELGEQVRDHLQLATLETRLSINSLLAMVVIAIIMALLLVTAWLALVGAVVMALIAGGLSPGVALLALTGANLAGALVGWLFIRRLSNSLGWPATLRALRPGVSLGDAGSST